MNWLSLINVDKFLLFTLILTRTSGLTMTAPIYGTRDVPAQVRVVLAIALALLIAPTQWHVSIAQPGSVLMYLVLIGGELLIGVCLGLAIVVLFSGIQLAGEMIGYVSGLMLASAYDPTVDSEVPVFSRLMHMVALAVFVCIGGHRMLMAGLLDTFQSIPPGDVTLSDSLAEAFVLLVGESFALAIRAAVPVVAAVLLATLVMGLIGRTLPQLNVLMVGFGLSTMLTFATLSLTLGAAVWVFQDQIEPTVEAIVTAIKGPGA